MPYRAATLRFVRNLIAISVVVVAGCSSDRRSDPVSDPTCDPCTCRAGALCLPQSSECTCTNRLHPSLDYRQHPFDFYDLATSEGPARLVGTAALRADEGRYPFVWADGTLTASPMPADSLLPLPGANMGLLVSNSVLYRLDFPSLTATRLSGDEPVGRAWPSSDQHVVVYTTYERVSGRSDLYAVTIDGEQRTRLTTEPMGTLVYESSTIYGPFSPSPVVLDDNSRVIFVTEGSTGEWSLYSVTPVGTGLIKLNGAGSVGSDRTNSFVFVASDDSSRIVYVADDDTPGVAELYAIAPNGTNRVKLSGALTGGGEVHTGYRDFTADVGPAPGRVIFLADRDGDTVLELWGVDLDGTDLVQLSGSESVSPYMWPSFSPDGSTVIFSDGLLRAVPAGGGVLTALSTGEVASYYELGPVFLPDGSALLYSARPDASSGNALYVASIDGLSIRTISGPFTDGGGLYSGGVGNAPFHLLADGQVLYRANPDGDYDHGLYIVRQDGSDLRRLTPPLVNPFYLTSNFGGEANGKVYFTSDAELWTYDELYAFDLATSERVNLTQTMPTFVSEDITTVSTARGGNLVAAATSYSFSSIARNMIVYDGSTASSCRVDLPDTSARAFIPLQANTFVDTDALYFTFTPEFAGDTPWTFYRATRDCSVTQLSAPVPAGGSLERMRVTPDSRKVVYTGAQDTTATELYAVGVDGTGRVRLNGALVVDGQVDNVNDGAFAISPDSTRVIYVADQDVDERWELYSVAIDGTNRVKLSPELGTGTVARNGQCFMPLYTSDGRSVVFAASVDAGPAEIFVNDAAGGALRKVSPPMAGSGVDNECRAIQLTPDGARIIYQARQESDARRDLYAMGLDGSANIKLSKDTLPGVPASELVISKNGTWGAYQSYDQTASTYRLVVVRLDGSDGRVVTGAPAGTYLRFFAFDDDATKLYFTADDGGASVSLFAARPEDGVGGELFDRSGGGTLLRVDFETTEDGRVVFAAQPSDVDATGVFAVSGSGVLTTIVAPVPGARVSGLSVMRGQGAVLVTADFDVPGVNELYAFPL